MFARTTTYIVARDARAKVDLIARESRAITIELPEREKSSGRVAAIGGNSSLVCSA